MRTYKYSDIVTNKDKVLLLGPGIPNNFGGMYSYMLLWFDEIKYFTKKYKLFIKKDIKIDDAPNITKQNIWSDKNQRNIKFLAILGLILPVSIVSFFFRKDFKRLVPEYTIAHVLTASFLTNTLIKILFFYNKNIRVIYTLHDPKSHDEKISFLGKKIKEYNLKSIYKLSEKNKSFFIHIHSEKLLKDCPASANNIIIHPHPLPKRLVKEKPVKKNNKIRFGFLGRIEAYKGLDLLFESFKSIEKEIAPFSEIVIIGRGDFEINKWKTQLNIDVKIVNEIVSDEYFHNQMNALDCLILPYRKASQSGVGYLALSYDIPIIASSTGGLPDIINQSNQNKSVLFPVNDHQELANAIKTFIT